MGQIVLMGSGETAPAMVKTHRKVLASAGPGAALMLDTPYGFQVNADDLTHRTVRYFAESVGHQVDPVRWRSRAEAGHERALAQISQGSWLFAGPGSPTYALGQWLGTPMPGAIDDLVTRGGTVVLGSAAAVTAGRWALPVYEIYKVGSPPHWVEGLDLLSRFVGVDVAVIPHYDNAEGGTYDTRFCYLGEARLAVLEEALDGATVLGVDEHTAVVVDLADRSVAVHGSGGMTLRRNGHSHVVPAGTEFSLDQLVDLVAGVELETEPRAPSTPASRGSDEPAAQPSLDRDVSRQRAAFDTAIEQRDVEAAVMALLTVEQAIADWSADTLQSDAIDRARRELRAMVVRLGELATAGVLDPAAIVAPVIDGVLAARQSAREAKDFTTSDLLRDVLARAGVEVNDTPGGVTWRWPDRDEPPASAES